MTRVMIVDYAWPTLDIEKSVLQQAGAELVVSETGAEEELLQLAPTVDAIMVCWKPLTGAVLRAATQCSTVARYGVGVDNIDVATATDLGIIVSNVPHFCTPEVADHTMALVLAHARRIPALASAVNSGGWDNTAAGPMRRLMGKTFGLVGYGSIAKEVALRAVAFGYEVIAYSPSRSGAASDGVVRFTASLNELLRSADVVSLHAPLSAQTRYLIGAKEIAMMKDDALLVNTSRGGLIDQAELAAALDSGRLGGAALDVLETEPPASHDAIFQSRRALITPHAAFNSVEAVEDLQRTAAENVAAVLQGRIPSSVVNDAVLTNSRLRRQARS
ncbi:C-terminal binding protein [Paenarthrobacter nitroguajacolicus]|uniref:C-terminal binding protein n=1 Tax=Paenarthrobacter nitroguajacolicus TaxID=211146 RepID=UPI003D22BF1C